jgi:hypothetical protein
MTTKKTKKFIPNWTFTTVDNVAMDIFKYTSDGNTWYNVTMTYFLDESDESARGTRGITIVTEINTLTVDEAIQRGFEALSIMFSKFSAIVSVVDGETDKVIDDIDLREYMDESEEDEVEVEDFDSTPIPNTRILH